MADDDVDGRQEFLLPSIVEGADEAQIVNWRVAVGDWVIIGRPMCTVESGGFVREFTSPFVGQVAELAAAVGETVAVGNVLVAVVDEDADLNTELDADAGEAEASVDDEVSVDDVEVVDSEPKQARPKHSPLVRRLAEEFEIDLATVEGTGAGGRITRDDVHRAAFPGEPLPGVATPTPTADDAADDAAAVDDEGVAGDGAGDDAATAEPEPDPEVEVTAEAEDVPVDLEQPVSVPPAASTFTVVSKADAAQLVRAHERTASRSGRALSLDALLVKLVGEAAQTFPQLASGGPDTVIGFCRSADSGMVVDVVSEVGSRSLLELDLMIGERTRAHQAGDESIVAPLTVIDAGALGATAITAPLAPGGVGCVTFGRPEPRVTVVDGIVQAGSEMTITASFDPQSIDLVTASAFIERVRLFVEDPILAFAG